MPAMTRPMFGRSSEVAALKDELAHYMRTARERAGLTQAQLAETLGMKYFTAISAIENGRNSVPPERYLDFAEALDIPPREFAKEVLRLTNPWMYAMLYMDNPRKMILNLNKRLSDRFDK